MQNIGTYDALWRIAAGSLALTLASSRSRWTTGTTLLAASGAWTLAEGVAKTCIMHSALGLTTADDANGKVLLRLGPIMYRRNHTATTRSLWGVDTEQGNDELSYHNADSVETHGWN